MALGTAEVNDADVRIEVVLPWLLQRLGEMVQGAIRSRAQVLLEKKNWLVVRSGWSVGRNKCNASIKIEALQKSSKKNRDTVAFSYTGELSAWYPSPACITMLGSFAEFERSIIRERTRAGLAAAKEDGRVGGRPRWLNDKQRREITDAVSRGVGRQQIWHVCSMSARRRSRG